MQIQEIKIERILNPTAIDLGEFVINPYRGCEYGCLYCYARFNKVNQKEKRIWGNYLDIRINSPECLIKELSKKKINTVLLGSTTECFQPMEKHYKITKDILRILNQNKIYYNILTRSDLILDNISLLNQGFCKNIYFTINNYDDSFKRILEPKSPSFQDRTKAINILISENINVIPYFSPILPFISDYKNIFDLFQNAKSIEFECLNFSSGNIENIIKAIETKNIKLSEIYNQMMTDKNFYEIIFSEINNEITLLADKAQKKFNIYIHKYKTYFENKYGQLDTNTKR